MVRIIKCHCMFLLCALNILIASLTGVVTVMSGVPGSLTGLTTVHLLTPAAVTFCPRPHRASPSVGNAYSSLRSDAGQDENLWSQA